MSHRYLFLLAICFSAMCNVGWGQVLDPPAKPVAQQLKPIKIEGIVSDVKKYSFVVTTKDASYVVKPQSTAIFTLRLNRPFFDFAKNRVKVFKANSILSENPEQEPAKPSPDFFELPQPLYVVSRFENNSLMERVMKMDVKAN